MVHQLWEATRRETHRPPGYPRRRYAQVESLPVNPTDVHGFLNEVPLPVFGAATHAYMCATVPAEAKAILGDRVCAGGVLGAGNSVHVDSFALRVGSCVQDGRCVQRVPRGQDLAHISGRQAWVRKLNPVVFRPLC